MSSSISLALAAATFASLVGFELRRPLRSTSNEERKLARIARNLAMAGAALPVVILIETPAIVLMTRWVAQNHVGLLQLFDLPRWLEVLLAFVLLDYTLWFWHRANHKLPFLWRFHLVHHVDRELDASTALRFHSGEITLSVVPRMLQILLIGPSLDAIGLWRAVLLISIMFHHSNARLPFGLERVLVRLVVTPRMHGIHHSNVREETDSNFSSILSIWDRFHRTLLLDVPQDKLVIGVPAYTRREDVSFTALTTLPFKAQRQDWVGADRAAALARNSTRDVLELAR